MTDAVSSPVSRTCWARGGKRVFDMVVGGVLLLLFFPLLVLIGLMVKLTSRGSLFFRQARVGMDGAVFAVLKFRTMCGRRTPDPKELVPLDHPDITRLGRVLRRCKMDELPQLLHVVAGQMSLVGPRPTLPDQVAAYDAFRRQRLLLRPGITGLAQTHGNSMMSWDERILYDIAYVRRCSFALDLSILLRTVWVVVAGEQHTSRPFAATRFAPYVTIPPDYGVRAM